MTEIGGGKLSGSIKGAAGDVDPCEMAASMDIPRAANMIMLRRRASDRLPFSPSPDSLPLQICFALAAEFDWAGRAEIGAAVQGRKTRGPQGIGLK